MNREEIKQDMAITVPPIHEQINFLQGARLVLTNNKDAQVIIKAVHLDMLKAIQENVIGVSRFEEYEKCQNKELIATLLEAKSLIKQWHGVGADEEVGKRMWKIYNSMSPEMKRLNEVIEKYTKTEVQNG